MKRTWTTPQELARQLAYEFRTDGVGLIGDDAQRIVTLSSAGDLQDQTYVVALCLRRTHELTVVGNTSHGVSPGAVEHVTDPELALHIRLGWERAQWIYFCGRLAQGMFTGESLIEEYAKQRLHALRSILEGYKLVHNMDGVALVLALAGFWL